jgi:hypothetical protein
LLCPIFLLKETWMTFEVVYECPDGTPFPVEWPDAAMTKHGWRWDQLHNSTPMTPLSQDLSGPKSAGMIEAADHTGHVFLGERIYAHGYIFSRSPDATEKKRRLFKEIAERDVISRMDRLVQLSESSYRPEVDVLTRSLRSWANPDDTADSLMKRFDEIEAIIGRLGELHELTMGLANTAAAQFSRFCDEEFGEDAVRIAEAAIAGLSNESFESADALWQLSRQVQSMPKVAELLRERSAEHFLDEVNGVENGGEFRLLLDEFLDEWGQRNESFNELAFQTWREDPRFVVSTVAAYLDVTDDRSPTAMNRRVAKAREAITAEAEERLADPEKIDAFRLVQRRT